MPWYQSSHECACADRRPDKSDELREPDVMLWKATRSRADVLQETPRKTARSSPHTRADARGLSDYTKPITEMKFRMLRLACQRVLTGPQKRH